MKMPTIDVDNLCFSYGNNAILHNVSLHLKGPKLYCIIGPNGVGKSTLIKCINGLLRITSGSVKVNGRDVTECSVKELADTVGYVPASSNIAFPMSVVDSILIAMDTGHKWKLRDDDVEIVYRALKIMNMSDFALRGCNELSAGQSQKVSLCRGLVRNSDILILDEPTSNLDVRHQLFITHFMKLLAERSEHMILMISHDLNLAARFADEVIVMSEPGVIYAMGNPDKVINERMIHDVYSVESKVIEDDGRPHIILKSAESW